MKLQEDDVLIDLLNEENHDEAKLFFSSLLNPFTPVKLLSRTYTNIAFICLIIGDLEALRKRSHKAYKVAKKTGSQELEVRAGSIYAAYLSLIGKYAESMDLYKEYESFKMSDQTAAILFQFQAYHHLCSYKYRDAIKSAHKSSIDAARLKSRRQKNSFLAFNGMFLAEAYKLDGREEQCFLHFESAMKYVQESNLKRLNRIINILIIEAQIEFSNYRGSLDEALNSLKLVEKDSFYQYCARSLARSCLLAGQPDLGLDIIDRALMKSTKKIYFNPQLLLLKSMILRKMGDPSSLDVEQKAQQMLEQFGISIELE